MNLSTTPKANGFTFPPEWHTHDATWLAWPHNKETWFERIDHAQEAFCRFVKIVANGEHVNLLVNDHSMQQEAQDKLDKAGVDLQCVTFHLFATNDAWCRDYGPSFIINNKEKAIINWGFNSWGEKYPPFDADDSIPEKIARHLSLQCYQPGIILEGGSVEFNGAGTVLTTKSCLLNKNRNPHLNQQEIEQYLKDYYGMEQVLWLEDGIEGDDTDGHIDDLTRFTNEHTVFTVIEENKHSHNYNILKSNAESLGKMKLPDGKCLDVIEAPLPAPVFYKGDILPASYANFYICNEAVVVPLFGDKNDDKVLGIIEKCFPEKRVEGIYSNDIIIGLGSFHCLSQQEPTVEKS